MEGGPTFGHFHGGSRTRLAVAFAAGAMGLSEIEATSVSSWRSLGVGATALSVGQWGGVAA